MASATGLDMPPEATVAKVIARFEKELRAALEKGAPVIEMPAAVEVDWRATKGDAKSKKQCDEEPIAGEEGEEEEDPWDINPI